MRLRSHAEKLLIAIWLLMTIVLANGYAGALFSFLSVAKLEPIVNSLDELINRNKFSLVTAASIRWVVNVLVVYIGSIHFLNISYSNVESLFYYFKECN